jgi:hypothetical protein
MFSYLYELLGGVIFMFYLHLLGFGKERFSVISNRVKNNTQKYKLQLLIIIMLILILIFIELDTNYKKNL